MNLIPRIQTTFMEAPVDEQGELIWNNNPLLREKRGHDHDQGEVATQDQGNFFQTQLRQRKKRRKERQEADHLAGGGRPPDPPDDPHGGPDGPRHLPAPALGQRNGHLEYSTQNGSGRQNISWTTWMRQANQRQAELEEERAEKQRRKLK